MKIKVSVKCMKCHYSLKEEGFLFDTEIVKALHVKCSNCESKWSIKVEEYEK